MTSPDEPAYVSIPIRILELRLDLEAVRRRQLKLELDRAVDDLENKMDGRDSCYTVGFHSEQMLNDKERALIQALRDLGWEEES